MMINHVLSLSTEKMLTPAKLQSPNTRSWYGMFKVLKLYKYIIRSDAFWICRLKSESMVQVKYALACLMIHEKRCSSN